MSLWKWFYERVIGTETPSVEVREYIRNECVHVSILEESLATTYLLPQERESAVKLLHEKRHVIATFERLYPGIVSKVL